MTGNPISFNHISTTKKQQTDNTMKTKINFSGKRPGTASSSPEIDRAKQRAIERAYQRLAAAVVIRAVADYRLFEEYKLVSRGHITSKGSRSPFRRDILALIKFLRGRGLGLLLEVGVFSVEQEMVMKALGFNFNEVLP